SQHHIAVFLYVSIHAPPPSLQTLHSFPTRRSSDLPTLNLMDCFVLNELFQDNRRRPPIDAHEGKKPTIKPGSEQVCEIGFDRLPDRKSTRLNSSHRTISYAVFCLKKKKNGARIS